MLPVSAPNAFPNGTTAEDLISLGQNVANMEHVVDDTEIIN